MLRKEWAGFNAARETRMGDSAALFGGFAGKRALVTGAGKGLGRAAAAALAEAGAGVIAVARSRADLDSLAAEHPGRVEGWAEDVTTDAFFDRAAALDRLDIAVACAGGNKPQPISDVTTETLDWMIGLNVRAVFRTAQAAAKVMRPAKSGVIIAMSSQMGHIGAPNRTLYCTTKHAVEGLVKALAVELAPEGIRVNSVAPTFIDTPMTRPMFEDPAFKESVLRNVPLGHIGTVDDVAAAVLYLASPAAAMVTGTSLRVDGGWTAW
jgi:NAD(P)-dependent dehydrogenase (short-subunit alcohol dehydrogenase family)